MSQADDQNRERDEEERQLDPSIDNSAANESVSPVDLPSSESASGTRLDDAVSDQHPSSPESGAAGDPYATLPNHAEDVFHTPQPNSLGRTPPVIGGELFVGRFKLLEVIGEGGMGSVWRARQASPVRREVAIKVIKPGMDSKQFVARFNAERQVLAMMEHPNVARVLDGGITNDGRPYFVMELVRGLPLTEYCDHRRLTVQQRLELFVQICSAVQHAHQKGIIHRDLKPGNILVMEIDGKPVPKIIDFGLAKVLGSGTLMADHSVHTAYGVVVGTPLYMAPEQMDANALDIDTRSDIYALGVILYELLTGATPLDRKRMKEAAWEEIRRIVREEDPICPSSRLSAADTLPSIAATRLTEPASLHRLVRGELDWIVMKSLEKDRNRRYDSASGFASDVQRYLMGEPVFAAPPSASYRIRKFVRKHRGPVVASSLIAAALVVAVVGTGRGWMIAQNQTAIAQKQTRIAEAESRRATREAENARLATEATEKTLEINRSNLAKSNFWLANARWGQGDALQANQLLQEIPDQFRNIEWRLAHRQFQGSYARLYGHESFVYCCAVSPDGKKIASAGRSILVWDAETGKPLCEQFGDHKDWIVDVAFTPDGKQILSASRDRTIKIWNSESRRCEATLTGHQASVDCIAVDPLGRYLVSASDDRTARIWDLDTRTTILSMNEHRSGLTAVAISPDGQRIATADREQKVKIWQQENGMAQVRLTIQLDMVAQSIAFSPDGLLLAVGGAGREIQLREVETAAQVHVLEGHENWVSHVAFSPDGRHLISSSRDSSIKLWDVRTGRLARNFVGHYGEVNDVRFLPDGMRIVSAGMDSILGLWDLFDEPQTRTLLATRLRFLECNFHPLSGRVAVCDDDQMIKIIDPVSGILESQIEVDYGSYSGLSWHPVLNLLAVSTMRGELLIVDTDTKAIKILANRLPQLTGARFSPDGKWIAAGNSQGHVYLWNWEQNRLEFELDCDERSVDAVAFSPDSSFVATCSANGNVRVWNLSTTKESNHWSRKNRSISDVAFFRDQNWIAFAGSEGSIEIIDWKTNQTVCRLIGHTQGITAICISKDDQRLISGSRDGTIRIWDTNNHCELMQIKAAEDLVWKLSLSLDNRFLAMTSLSSEFKIWDLRETETVQKLADLDAFPSTVRLDQSGNTLYCVDNLGTHWSWDVSTGKQLPLTGVWPDILQLANSTTDGRYFAFGRNKSVVVVDKEYSETSVEQDFRKFRARARPWKHLEIAEAAESDEDWFAAAYHWEQILTINDPSIFALEGKSKQELENRLEKSRQAIINNQLKRKTESDPLR